MCISEGLSENYSRDYYVLRKQRFTIISDLKET
jgi:hypothetical protein